MRWQSLKEGIVENLHPFGQELQAFLLEERQMRLLPDCGWMDGGCLILASALRSWSRGRMGVAAWMRASEGSPDGVLVDHYAAVIVDEGDVLLLDGDGLGTAEDFASKMAMERVAEGFLVVDALPYFEAACAGKRPSLEANLYPGNPVATLVKHLTEAFGDFSMERVWLGWPEELPEDGAQPY